MEPASKHGHVRTLAVVQIVLAAACGMVAANVYYAQPLTGLISAAFGMPHESTGLFVTLPLAGYGIGLLTIVPLGDLFENRRLALTLVGAEMLCTLALSLTTIPTIYLGIAFLTGLLASVVQLFVPYVTYLVPKEDHSRAVGRAISGLMLGVMLARPVASMIASVWSWREVFRFSSVLMGALMIGLHFVLPPRSPAQPPTYGSLLRSLGGIFAGTELLRRRGLYHAAIFGSFSIFWTAVPLWLSSPKFGLSQKGIAWVALAGVAGAIAPPIAGRIADKGFTQAGTAGAMLLASASFLVSDLAFVSSNLSLTIVIVSAVLLDSAVSANLLLSQRAIYSLGSEQRSRLNGLFMATFFAGGAVSSALSGWVFARSGWTGVSILGMLLPLVALLYFATERRGSLLESISENLPQ
ncbi:MFS transporter [Paraburkholderia panacisoli]|uniref:MFS transporter n=1 Tax=Paraburkholderia panacisoli TaxID=2603818 RepID=A0A5B0G278_9BURK|nr:MFS transporter [Paraburkholderia panacisoli]KAA0997332.1 MFS transporter [Paraburkholderia panacisoli]